ncbi:unnamed protein product [Moneuplotes crassus]|uniref:LITAF domain-containing protein n=1 Tax=Euplotes crassus TaxID=5936 RepID=A0AAD2D488_EUPCR|nr:unnamed protein product [Moneuplotes crassus]
MEPCKEQESETLLPEKSHIQNAIPITPQNPPQGHIVEGGQYPVTQPQPIVNRNNQFNLDFGVSLGSNNQNPGGIPPGVPLANAGHFRGRNHSTYCRCTVCGQAVFTRVVGASRKLQWIGCLIMCIFGCWCCCCIPFCIKEIRTYQHFCPECGYMLGTNGL